MKLIGLAGILALSSLSCQRKEEITAAKPAASTPAETAAPGAPAPAAGEKKEAPPESKPTKARERPAVTEKKPPVAEPLADKPGFVKSPFSGEIIDVKGIPAGTLVADPMYPMDQKKHFRVPKMSPEHEAAVKEEKARRELAEETAKLNALVAESVPGRPGFIFSPYTKAEAGNGPYDRYVIDASMLEPGSVIKDPTSTLENPRYLKVPGGDSPVEGE